MTKFENVIQQIRNGEKDAKVIDLSNCNLSKFPVEVFEFKDSLELLNLGGNTISCVPDEIRCLKKLKILFFAGNSFTEIPPVLGQMQSISMLSFKSNRIDNIPPESLNSNLVWLILTDNKITSLPPTIGKLTLLRKLMLSGNCLTNLPIEMSNCQDLELVRLAVNQLVDIPNWLLSAPKLSWIALAGNPCIPSTQDMTSNLEEVSWEDIEVQEILGQGASGIVSKAIWNYHKDNNSNQFINSSTTITALKLFKGEVTSDGVPADEMAIASSIGSHPHIQQVLAKVINAPSLALLFKLIDPSFTSLGGPPSFDTVTRDTYPSSQTFSLPFIVNVICGIASAATHLTSLGIMHGDLYAHNILVTSEGNPILGDFGAAFSFDKKSERAILFEKIEIRAFGCLIEDLMDHIDTTSCISSENIEIISSLRSLQRTCMAKDQSLRPAFHTVHNFLQKLKINISNRSSLGYYWRRNNGLAATVGVVLVVILSLALHRSILTSKSF